MDEAEFQLLYGPWRPLEPTQVRDLFAGASFRWWIAGGWAIELAGGEPRHHDDTDVVVLLDDLDAVRSHLAAYHLWEAHEGLRPLLPGEELRPEREQLWVRRNANEPWLADLLLNPSSDGRWLFKRGHGISLPLDEIGATRDGVSYLRPHVALLHKAKNGREKDDRDFDAVLPLLSEDERRWLDEALSRAHPEHAWRSRLR